MKWTDISHGMVIAAEQRLWVALGDDAHKVITRINTDSDFVTHLAKTAVDAWFYLDDKSHAGLKKKSPEPNSMRLNLILPPEIVMVATGRHFRNDPAIKIAVYRKEFDAGQPNTSLVSEGDFGELKVRNFFPGSGCGFIWKAGTITKMEPGLQNFKGKSATITGNVSCDLLVVWKNKPVPLSTEFVESLIAVLGNLSMVLR